MVLGNGKDGGGGNPCTYGTVTLIITIIKKAKLYSLIQGSTFNFVSVLENKSLTLELNS